MKKEDLKNTLSQDNDAEALEKENLSEVSGGANPSRPCPLCGGKSLCYFKEGVTAYKCTECFYVF